jgi:hypothetical protein
MAGVHHDAVKGDALLSEAERKLEVLGISGMVEVDGDRNRGAVCTTSEGSMEVDEGTLIQLTHPDRIGGRGPFRKQG